MNYSKKNELYQTEESLLQIEQLQQELISTTTRIEGLESTLAEIAYRREKNRVRACGYRRAD